MAASIGHLEAGVESATDERDRAMAARALARALVPLERIEEAVAVLEETVTALPASARELATQLTADLATAARLTPRTYPRAAAMMSRHARMTDASTPAERALLTNVAFERMLGGGPASDAASLAELALDGGFLAEQTSASPTFYDAPYVLIVADRFERAERVCAQAIDDARRRGSLFGFALASCFRSHLHFRTGALLQAEADARASIEAAQGTGWRFVAFAFSFLIDALVERGRLEEATAVLTQADGGGEIADTLMQNQLLWSRGQLSLARGEPAAALRDYDELGRREQGLRGRCPAAIPYRSAAAMALARLGERDEALRRAREELELARTWDTPRTIGVALRALGAIEGGDDGFGHLSEAVEILAPSGAQLEYGWALADLGAALRRSNRRRDARAPLRQACDLAERSGAARLAEHARSELAATGARPRTVLSSGVDSLTASERRTAEMATAGMTNREIAEALFVTKKTVETHLGHCYQKLGIESRAQLADALAPPGN